MRLYITLSLLLLLQWTNPASAWVGLSSRLQSVVPPRTSVQRRRTALKAHEEPLDRNVVLSFTDASKAAAASLALCSVLLLTTAGAAPALAYESTDYASETVQAAVKSVNDAVGNVGATVQAFENIAEIITEGKGVGGEINFKGVQLDRGFVADEDTAIYNPGLTLLTESEKDRLVEAIVQSKKMSSEWNPDTEAGYSFLRERLDPLHMYELRGYLTIVPFYGAALYLAALAAQQLARDIFPAVYIACALAVFVPAIVLVFLGP
jgi:hypothetical protein